MQFVKLAEYALMVFCCVAAVAFVIAIIKTEREDLAARREFHRLLVENAGSLRGLRERIMLDGVATFDELAQLVRALERVAEGLSERHRKVVVWPLQSHDAHQRARYAAHVMNKAGIGSGYIPIPSV
jgi:hypothetical protein